MKNGRRFISTSFSTLVLAFLPISSFALGLGDIRLHSYLNEPLDAEIALFDIKDLDLNNIKVNIADPNAFMKAGLEAPAWLSTIQFEVIGKTASGTPSIRLTTEQPVKDPFLDLLVVAAWPDGKLVKAYTLLLDPPKISANAGRIPLHPNASKIRFGGQYRPGYHEALWNIAKRLVENTSFSIYQGMMAIAQKNPQAFKHGSIHEMREGVILTLPVEAEIQRHTVDEAQHFVESQSSDKRQVGAPVDKQGSTASQTTIADNKPLKIVAADNLIGNEKLDASSNMSQRLSLIEEAIDTLKRTNEEISKKNQELQQQNETLTALLAQKNQEINLLKNEPQSLEQPVVLAKPETPLSSLVPLDLSTDKPVAPIQPVMPKASPQTQPAVTNPAVTPQVSRSLWTVSNLLIMVIFLVAAVLVVLLVMKRKTVVSMLQNPKKAAAPKKKLILTATANENLSSSLPQFDLDKALEAVTLEEKKYSKPAAIPVLEKDDIENGGKKAIASLEDAEIYIAYERYAQAEKVLQQILAQQPNHWNALLKLLELYVLTEKYQEFEKVFAMLPKDLKELSPNTWSKIELLLEKVQSEKVVPMVPISNTALQAEDLQKAASQGGASTGASSPKKLSEMVPKFTLEQIEPEAKPAESKEESSKSKDDI